MNELKTLTNMLQEHKLVKEFKVLEKAVNENENLKESLSELYELQQEMVQLKHLEKFKMYEIVKETYNKKRKKLENDPLVVNFLELQEEVNNLLKQIKFIIEKEIEIKK